MLKLYLIRVPLEDGLNVSPKHVWLMHYNSIKFCITLVRMRGPYIIKNAIPVVCNIGPTTTEAFISFNEKHLYSLLTEDLAMHYHSLCLTYFHLAI
jgi:hypothetical protein